MLLKEVFDGWRGRLTKNHMGQRVGIYWSKLASSRRRK